MNGNSQTVEPWMGAYNRLRKKVSASQFAIDEAYNQGVWDTLRALHDQQAGPADAVTPAMLQEACDIGLAVAGSLATDGDGAWLQRNEARLRELEQIARRSATPEGGKHG